MKKHWLAVVIFCAYNAVLIKIMVFKDLPPIRVGQLIFNFGGTDVGHGANFMPLATILPYLFGYKGWIIAGINLIGNIILLVPLGFLLPFVYRKITWKQSFALAVVIGLIIETMQTVLRVGIFDIDDVILNAFGFMLGYGMSVFFTKWQREGKYKNIFITLALLIGLAAGAFYAIYPHGQPVVNPRSGAVLPSERIENEAGLFQGDDLCGGTGGAGRIVSIGDDRFTIEQKDGSGKIVNLVSRVEIETVTGPAAVSDLKIGDRVTLVGGPNSDGSFTADTVVVCTP